MSPPCKPQEDRRESSLALGEPGLGLLWGVNGLLEGIITVPSRQGGLAIPPT